MVRNHHLLYTQEAVLLNSELISNRIGKKCACIVRVLNALEKFRKKTYYYYYYYYSSICIIKCAEELVMSTKGLLSG